MPVTIQLATAVATRVGWMSPLADAAYIAAINSNDPDSTGSLTTTSPVNTLGSATACDTQNLPVIVSGGRIVSVIVESSSRRAGASNLGQYQIGLNDPTIPATVLGPVHQPGAPAPPGLARYFDDFTLNVPGPSTRWTYNALNIVQSGWIFGPVAGTGINVYYLGINTTWFDESGGFYGPIIGGSWLPPLIAAGLGGINLLYENCEKLAILFLDIYKSANISTFPAVGIKSERETICRQLLCRPKFCFLGV